MGCTGRTWDQLLPWEGAERGGQELGLMSPGLPLATVLRPDLGWKKRRRVWLTRCPAESRGRVKAEALGGGRDRAAIFAVASEKE